MGPERARATGEHIDAEAPLGASTVAPAVPATTAARRVEIPVANTTDLYTSRRQIHPRNVTGIYQRRRLIARVGLLGGLVALPWLSWNGAPLVWLDLPARRFHVLGATYFADDVFLATGLLVVGAFALFTFTNVAGRVLCGYACPHSMYFSLFIAVEEWLEGSALHRRRRDREGWRVDDRLRRGATYSVWLLLGFAFAFSTMGLFVPGPTLVSALLQGTVDGWIAFWLVFLTFGCVVFAGFLREQACFYMCPYARFQSAMIDRDTLVVSYDAERGEPRGSAKSANRSSAALGDCVDCRLCVDVCPVGIDIRDGLQYQCIQCGLCVDACAPVMSKLGRPAGLVRYSTQNWIEHRLSPFRLHRPRLVGYAAVTILITLSLATLLWLRTPFELSVIRERQSLFNATWAPGTDGPVQAIENGYRLELANKTSEPLQFHLAVRAPFPTTWLGPQQVRIDSGEIVELPIRLRVPLTSAPRGSVPITFTMTAGNRHREREQRFFGPSAP